MVISCAKPSDRRCSGPGNVSPRNRATATGYRCARPLDRMPVDASTLDPALHHAVADAGPRELHDDVRRAGQQGHCRQTVLDGGAATAPPSLQRRMRRFIDRALDMRDRLVDRHDHP